MSSSTHKDTVFPFDAETFGETTQSKTTGIAALAVATTPKGALFLFIVVVVAIIIAAVLVDDGVDGRSQLVFLVIHFDEFSCFLFGQCFGC